MSRYLLDTNILSDLIKPAPSASLLDWMADRVDENLFIASLTVAEIWRGILEKPAGDGTNWKHGSAVPRALAPYSLAESSLSTMPPVWSGPG